MVFFHWQSEVFLWSLPRFTLKEYDCGLFTISKGRKNLSQIIVSHISSSITNLLHMLLHLLGLLPGCIVICLQKKCLEMLPSSKLPLLAPFLHSFVLYFIFFLPLFFRTHPRGCLLHRNFQNPSKIEYLPPSELKDALTFGLVFISSFFISFSVIVGS